MSVLTEQEASERWCPFARMADCERGFGYNRWDAPDGPLTARCIAAACMAWRWGPLPYARFHVFQKKGGSPNYIRTSEPDRPSAVPLSWEWRAGNPDDDQPAGWREPDDEAVVRRKGYCGLAGEPRP